MAELLPFEQIDAGGVDSRSNPINLPRNRALRCLNWVPKQAGFWELRYGYSTVTMSTVTASAIHSIFPYRTITGGKFVLFMSNDKTLKQLDTSTGTVTTPTFRGTAIASSAKGAGFFANNRFKYGNGTDQKWFDGTTWRNDGLPALTLTQIANVTVTEGVRELTSTQASTVTLTAAAGGSFPADTLTGHLMYVLIFDTSTNELGPATISVSSGRIVVALNNKITVANMPNLSGVNANWVKLIGGTIDGGNLAFFFTNTSTNINSISCSGTTMTVSATAHGLSTGDVVKINGVDSFFAPNLQQYDRVFKVTVSDANTFTVVLSRVAIGSPAISTPNALVTRIVMAPNATTTVDVLAPTQEVSANTVGSQPYQVNQNLGLAASAVGGSNPGYQFYASIYNPTGGAHVGNRIAIGGRALQTAYRSNWHIAGLPDLSATDTEWTVLIGRTGDGAQVPYAVADNAVNWLYALSAQTSITVSDANIDGAHELPTRNGIIPAQCNMFCLAGDFAYAADTSSPTLRRSGSFLDDRAGSFTGRPEQSWAPNDIDTFPTAEACTGMFEIDQEVFMGTLHDSALSVNLAGIQQWVGPWAIGIAGRRAGTKCGAQGFFWVTGDKQLATFSQGVPIVVSEEYEVAELSQIGDAFLSSVECVYYRSAFTNKEELRIEAQQSDGTPYTIIHDFKLKDASSAPYSIYGQGYSSQFQGPLGLFQASALASDNFNRADENPILSPWISLGLPGFVSGEIVSNQFTGVAGTGSGDSLYDGGISWPADQFSQATLRALTVATSLGLLWVRASAGNGVTDGNGYAFVLNTGTGNGGIGIATQVAIFAQIAGVQTNLVTGTITPQAGDVYYLQAIGQSISVLRNGVKILQATDSQVASGKPGLGAEVDSGGEAVAWDDWSGGSITSAVSFTSALVRDGNGKLQIYVGSSNGQLYQLYSGADDVGNQYSSDLILLLNGGPNRPSAPFFDYYGDQNVAVTLGRNLSSSLAPGAPWGFDPPNSDANVAQVVQGAEQDFLFRVFLVPPEVQRLYVRFQLQSHSADGNLNMNSPPHVPLENYGRIYELVPAIGDERDR